MNRTTDPNLESLVPRTTRTRSLLGALAVLALLAGAWCSVDALRPGVVPAAGGGSWSPDVVPGRVVATFTLVARGWTGAEVTGVQDVDGARVTGVWVLPVPPGRTTATSTTPTAAAELWVPDDAELAHLVGDTAHAPVRLTSGERALLVVAWEITDCARLRPDLPPRVDVGSFLGVHHTEVLPDVVSPAFDVAALGAAGLCG